MYSFYREHHFLRVVLEILFTTSQSRGWRSVQTLCWQVRLLGVIVIVIFHLPISLGQKPVIFQYHEFPFTVPSASTASVSITDLNVTYFNDWGSDLLLNNSYLDSGPEISGSCFYSNLVQLTQPCKSENTTVTSFSTMFSLAIVQDPASDNKGNAIFQGLNFTITSSISNPVGPLADAVLAVEIVGGSLIVTVDKSSHSFNFSDVASTRCFISQSVVWVQYDGPSHELDVFISAWYCDAYDITEIPKNKTPLASINIDLTNAFSSEGMYVGFSGSISIDSANSQPGDYYGYKILQWTFNSNGLAPDYPRDADGYPRIDYIHWKARSWIKTIVGIAIPSAVLIVCVLVSTIILLYRRNVQLTELAKKHDINVPDSGPIKFKYKTLSDATKGFSEKELLGKGGFGSVYRGTLALKAKEKQTEVAVKKLSANSKQGARQFQAEVDIIGQLQHRNVVRLLGWCHDRGELLLVYDYMPNGSVDQLLYADTAEEPLLTWTRRLTIMSGVAKAVAFLHDEWNKQVIHRDLKTSNVMLDGDFEARLGDFGLARLYDHGEEPLCTHFAGTHGYMAPELGVTCKPTEKTDVYSFGAMVLELATGKHPLLSKDDQDSLEEVLLVDWVWGLYRNGTLLDAADSRLHNTYDRREMTKFLKIGLLCCHTNPNERPNMRDVISIWIGKSPFPQLPRSKPLPSFPISMDHSSELLADHHDIDTLSLFPEPHGSTDVSQTYHTALSFPSNDVNRDSLAVEIGEEQPADTQDSTLRYRATTTHLPFS